ncbi:MAG: inositol monophosphatase [Clostridiales bacterium]|nr:inositol monophosphatase [Clostridiales bacterium]
MRYNVGERELIRLVHRTGPIFWDSVRVSQVREKGLDDFVTQADLAVQDTLRGLLRFRWPGIGFLAEEDAARPAERDRPLWILDPIDGTNNLIHGFRESAVSLALWDGGRTVMGVVYNPFQDETFSATLGRGARCNGRPIQVSDRPDLAHSLAIFGTSPYEKERADLVFQRAKAVYLRTEDLRRGGSAALELCKVAAGRAELYFEYDLKPWDYAAGQLILREAGGACTDLAGGALPVTENADLLATNRRVHAEALEVLRQGS